MKTNLELEKAKQCYLQKIAVILIIHNAIFLCHVAIIIHVLSSVGILRLTISCQ